MRASTDSCAEPVFEACRGQASCSAAQGALSNHAVTIENSLERRTYMCDCSLSLTLFAGLANICEASHPDHTGVDSISQLFARPRPRAPRNAQPPIRVHRWLLPPLPWPLLSSAQAPLPEFAQRGYGRPSFNFDCLALLTATLHWWARHQAITRGTSLFTRAILGLCPHSFNGNKEPATFGLSRTSFPPRKFVRKYV